jgi:hypothetical protein
MNAILLVVVNTKWIHPALRFDCSKQTLVNTNMNLKVYSMDSFQEGVDTDAALQRPE